MSKKRIYVGIACLACETAIHPLCILSSVIGSKNLYVWRYRHTFSPDSFILATQTLSPDSVTHAMITGASHIYHFISFSVALTLATDRRVSRKQKPFGFICLHTNVMLLQFKLNILIHVWGDSCISREKLLLFWNLSHWIGFGHWWTNLPVVQTWYKLLIDTNELNILILVYTLLQGHRGARKQKLRI